MLSPLSFPAVEAALRSAAAALADGVVQVYLAGPDGRLVWAAATGDGPDLAPVAEMLGAEATVLDLQSVTADARIGVGVGWSGPRRGAVLALSGGEAASGALDCVADAACVVQALVADAPVAAPPAALDAVTLLADLATMPGTFDERLGAALERLAHVLGMEASAVALIDDGRWTPFLAFDPGGVWPTGAVALAETPCAVTVLADGPVGDARRDGPLAAYLGVPLWGEGRCMGTLCAASRHARDAFTDAERSLVAGLARWASAALTGRQAAGRLAEREATLAAFLDTVPLALGTLDLDAAAPGGVRLVTANVHAVHAIGAADLLPLGETPGAASPWAAACRTALATGTTTRFSFGARRDGDARRFVATLVVLDAAVPRFSFVAEDVTDRDAGARATAELHRAEATASEARRALLTHVAHELRSPLTAILGYADLLSPDSPPDEIVEAREVVARAGGRMLAALDNLATLALVEAGRVTAAAVPVYAGAVVAAIAQAHGPQAAARRTALDVVVALPDDVPVLLDPDLFERLVRTLVDAAIAATTGGRVDGRLAVDGDALVFDLCAHPAEPDAGLGPLGADFVRRLVGVMDGRVDTAVDTMAGTWRWTVRLPYRVVPLVDLAPPATAHAAPHGGAMRVGEDEAVAEAETAG